MISMRTAASIALSVALALGVGAVVEPEVAAEVQSAAIRAGASARAGVDAFVDTVVGWNLDFGTDLQLDLLSRSEAAVGSAPRVGAESGASVSAAAGEDAEASMETGPLVKGASQFDLGVGADLLAEGFFGANSQ